MPTPTHFFRYKEGGDNFVVYPITKKFDVTKDNYSAVYIFADVDFIPLYIGETEELAERINNHEKLRMAKDNGCKFICVLKVSEAKREVIEDELIDVHKPRLNSPKLS